MIYDLKNPIHLIFATAINLLILAYFLYSIIFTFNELSISKQSSGDQSFITFTEHYYFFQTKKIAIPFSDIKDYQYRISNFRGKAYHLYITDKTNKIIIEYYFSDFADSINLDNTLPDLINKIKDGKLKTVSINTAEPTFYAFIVFYTISIWPMALLGVIYYSFKTQNKKI
jgi:hypothetical protein